MHLWCKTLAPMHQRCERCARGELSRRRRRIKVREFASRAPNLSSHLSCRQRRHTHRISCAEGASARRSKAMCCFAALLSHRISLRISRVAKGDTSEGELKVPVTYGKVPELAHEWQGLSTTRYLQQVPRIYSKRRTANPNHIYYVH